ncbi:MAG: L-histidine N(alpha)-methyltransferase [Cyanobacteria bacterium P01_G01_bin.67]
MSTFSDSANSDRHSVNNRLDIDYLLDPQLIEQDDIQDVIQGLRQTPKVIPARYFYDAQGSQLFEAICQLPEYYPTRTEASILQQNAASIIRQTKVVELVELGSGSSTKTRYLLDAHTKNANTPLYYVPVDVSDSILQESAENLLADYPQLKIQGKVATYSQALAQLAVSSFGKRIIIFLGSSIGNFNSAECDRFINQVTLALNPGDFFLLGIDLQKPVAILEIAYNDAQGITAKFNLNMLQHLNHRFSGNFKLDLFKHQAIYNQTQQQIEMYLISQQEQTVSLDSLHLTINLAKDEKILTEISRKFNLETMEKYLGDRNLNIIQSYTDDQQWFGLLLCQLTSK